MAYKSDNEMFLDLNDEQEESFRKWVHHHIADYLHKTINDYTDVWHPVCIDEARKLKRKLRNEEISL